MILQRFQNMTRLWSSALVTTKRCISNGQVLQQTVKNHTPNSLEKRFLVWSGKYKSIDEIPLMINPDVMERARNKMRIRFANIMMGLTVIGACIAIYSGKQAAKRGETLGKQNLDWHREYNERFSNKEGKQ